MKFVVKHIMRDLFEKHIAVSMKRLEGARRGAPRTAAFERALAELAALLVRLEFSAAVASHCVAVVRNAVNHSRALERPQAARSVHAILLDALEGAPELAELFHADGPCMLRQVQPERPLRQVHAPYRSRMRSLYVSMWPAAERHVPQYGLMPRGKFTPAAAASDVRHRLDSEGINHHLRRIGRDFGPEPPDIGQPARI